MAHNCNCDMYGENCRLLRRQTLIEKTRRNLKRWHTFGVYRMHKLLDQICKGVPTW